MTPITKQKPEIDFEDFSKVEIRVGEIIECDYLEGSEKILKLKVDFGDLGLRQILSGIAKHYSPQELLKKKTLFVLNIKPRKILGYESQGMLFAADNQEGRPVFVVPEQNLHNGAEMI
ncbi:methionine--tRNA ligase subunit beta [Candidatus Nomurabacteria bacterium]|uniref:Methionine--tRNA ligase n=1 Tax=candidate division WWE3 bacterium TaxID=2053526 RepID=A0A955IVT8_UNCKA|nr:methionine--tRNA ligase subunit beta [candidate division WWE3 bacterium]MCB9823840.1 methionine--tRNA ligase subunit beta [Candidatus Nomurabacteria bacterium]MCB9826755.1 methionine--tRNA ligase subunit beta [Candidatus Nomurabacteria bacterium]MCB9827634.1 methionine--tRNA ligase subunit beta [Candidatus Nomurabacteria bacterium]HXK52801.1 methionine--tRNA ligase subunit beta [bacterium]